MSIFTLIFNTYLYIRFHVYIGSVLYPSQIYRNWFTSSLWSAKKISFHVILVIFDHVLAVDECLRASYSWFEQLPVYKMSHSLQFAVFVRSNFCVASKPSILSARKLLKCYFITADITVDSCTPHHILGVVNQAVMSIKFLDLDQIDNPSLQSTTLNLKKTKFLGTFYAENWICLVGNYFSYY